MKEDVRCDIIALGGFPPNASLALAAVGGPDGIRQCSVVLSYHSGLFQRRLPRYLVSP